MAARRLIFVLIVMLMLSSFAAALVPVSNRDEEDSSPSTTPEAEAEPSRAKLVHARIAADAGKPKTIRIELGDQLALAVTATRAAEVEIAELGEFEDVEPGTAARFDLLPLEAGTYDVRLVEPDRLLGRIVVARRTAASGKSPNAAGKRESVGS